MTTMATPDGVRRGYLDVRPLTAEQGSLSRADGSGEFSFGSLQVLASVVGPTEVRIRDELLDRATLEVVVRSLKGVAGVPTKSLADTLHTLLSPVLLLHAHPRSLIQLVIQTTASPPAPSDFISVTSPLSLPSPPDAAYGQDGEEKEKDIRTRRRGPDAGFGAAEKAAAVNAATLALMDAGVGLRGVVVGVSCAVLEKEEARRFRVAADEEMETETDAEEERQRVLLLDPTPAEEAVALSSHFFAFAYSSAFEPPPSVRNAAAASRRSKGGDAGEEDGMEKGRTGELVGAESWGRGREEEYFEALSVARRASARILSFIRRSVEEHLLGQSSSS